MEILEAITEFHVGEMETLGISEEEYYEYNLRPAEQHPSKIEAFRFLSDLGIEKLLMYQEAYSTTAIEGNRTSKICLETLKRVLKREPTSDRYLLGLAWSIMSMEVLGKD